MNISTNVRKSDQSLVQKIFHENIYTSVLSIYILRYCTITFLTDLISLLHFTECSISGHRNFMTAYYLKGEFAKNERGYRLTAKNKRL